MAHTLIVICRPTWVKHLLGAPLYGKLLASPTKLDKAGKAYYENPWITAVKSFIVQALKGDKKEDLLWSGGTGQERGTLSLQWTWQANPQTSQTTPCRVRPIISEVQWLHFRGELNVLTKNWWVLGLGPICSQFHYYFYPRNLRPLRNKLPYPLQGFQNALAYFAAAAVSYPHKMFMKLRPGNRAVGVAAAEAEMGCREVEPSS